MYDAQYIRELTAARKANEVARALIKDHERTIVAQRAELDALRAQLDAAEQRYMSAVDGRAKFREAFRRARAESKAAREWMATYAEPLLGELAGYQNGNPDMAAYIVERDALRAEVAALRAQVEATHDD